MNVIVFEMTCSVGQLIFQSLLEAGRIVSAFAHARKKLEVESPSIKPIAADALDAGEVSAAVRGRDAVITTLGANVSRKSVKRPQGTLSIINAIQAHRAAGLISQSMLGAHLAPVFRDHELQEQLVEASGLHRTIVRPGAFTDAQTRKDVIENVAPTARGPDLKVARSNVARFLTRQLVDRTYIDRLVGLSS